MQTKEQRDAYLRDLHIAIHGREPGPADDVDLAPAPQIEPDDELAAELEVEKP